MVKVHCHVCKKEFELGVNGIVDEQQEYICDGCGVVERDSEGNCWLPGETQHIYVDVDTWKESIVTRDEAISISKLGTLRGYKKYMKVERGKSS